MREGKKRTDAIFGPLIDKYTIRQAVHDGAVVLGLLRRPYRQGCGLRRERSRRAAACHRATTVIRRRKYASHQH
jgi:type I site-specific restriction-modification system R (restriction) subunit